MWLFHDETVKSINNACLKKTNKLGNNPCVAAQTAGIDLDERVPWIFPF